MYNTGEIPSILQGIDMITSIANSIGISRMQSDLVRFLRSEIKSAMKG